jgi:menaquinone-9 beta-reductase
LDKKRAASQGRPFSIAGELPAWVQDRCNHLSCTVDHYDIAIIGAGPAGATCALALRDAGLRVALLDRAAFPRDKVCGDAIPARAVRVLEEVAPLAAKRLEGLPQKTKIHACTVFAPNGRPFTYHFTIPGYCAKRLDFDNFLVGEAIQDPRIHFLPGRQVTHIRRDDHGWILQTEQPGEDKRGLLASVSSPNHDIRAKLIIGCDGVNGVSAKQLARFEMDPRHHCAAVRAYYTDVKGLQADSLEIHLLQDWLPGYFWVFPLGTMECNVGFGMLSHHVAARKVSLRPALEEIIGGTPALSGRFEGARLQSKVQGFGLPLGSRWMQHAGEGFMLCGDAASLIDPATGEGIGNAMWSAQLAAQWAIQAFQKDDFSQNFLDGYAQSLRSKLQKELRRKYWVQRLVANRPGLLNLLIGQAGRKGLVNGLVRKLF